VKRSMVGVVRLVVVFAVLGLLLAASATAGEKRYRDKIFKVTVKRGIVYGSGVIGTYGEREDLALDLYKPKRDKVKRRPVAVWVHGGGFAFGDKGSGPSAQLARRFARMGYVTVSINYRLLVEGGCSGATGIAIECYRAAIEGTHDAQAAVRWLRANAKRLRVDPKRIGIGGESAGAIISAGVGVLSAQPGESGNPGFPSDVGASVSISGGLPGGLFVDDETAPGIMFASTGDPIVPYVWSVETFDAMTALGIPAKLTTFESNVHVPWEQYRALITKQARNFLYRQLDLADAPQ